MMIKYCYGLHLLFYLIIFLELALCLEENCNRRPLGAKTQPLPPDNRFVIDVNTTGDEYIPRQSYKVLLHSADNSSTFIGFTISIREDTAPNDKNPRKPKHLDPGQLHPSPLSEGVVVHRKCKNTVVEQDITPKTSVEALWIAPSKDNKCVTIYAVVAVKPDVWYSYEGPLSKRICENRRKADDMQPLVIMDCNTCEEARYQMLFEGMWSANTHPLMFPTESLELVRFSDVVGASHNRSFILYKDYSEASPGLKMLAEQGNTTELEIEIIRRLGESVRTVIKATGPPKTNESTVASFRVSPTHHLVSIAVALLPSPDWFLGVSNMELCTGSQWADTATLNLYPMDAGTDSGMTFGAPNEDTLPPQPISEAIISKGVPREDMKPFARLRFTLIRTYPTSSCASSTTAEDNAVTEGTNFARENRGEEPEVHLPPHRPSEEPTTVSPDPDSNEDCLMTAWSDWESCDGSCEDGVRSGYHTRYRHHIVDGTVLEYLPYNGIVRTNDNVFVVPEECRNAATEDFESCQEPCEEETATQIPDDEAEMEAASSYRWRRWTSAGKQRMQWNRKNRL